MQTDEKALLALGGLFAFTGIAFLAVLPGWWTLVGAIFVIIGAGTIITVGES